jgi:hypothetical protein
MPEGAQADFARGAAATPRRKGGARKGGCHSLKTEQRASTSDQLGVPGQLRREPVLARQCDSLERR